MEQLLALLESVGYERDVPVDVLRLIAFTDIAFDAHLDLTFDEWMSPDVYAEFASEGPSESSYRIVVNAHLPAHKERFVLAHELSHFVLHRKMLGATHTDGKSSVRTMRSQLFSRGKHNLLEVEANEMAAQLLMPKDRFIEMHGSLVDRGIPEPVRTAALGTIFKVSEQAASIRSKVLGLA